MRVVHHGASADPAAPKVVTEDEIQLALLVRGPSVEAPSREEARLRFAVSCGRALWSADERTYFMDDLGRDIEGRCRRYTLAREDAPASAV